MANTKTLSRSFSGGELSPEMYGRIDDNKYQAGAAKLLNFIATPQGPAENRPGFAYVNSTKNNGVARLIPFTFNVDQTMVVEMGAGYFRFHTLGETLQYETTGIGWVAPSGAISISYTTPTVVTWTAHGLTDGNPVVFYIYGDHGLGELPAGFKVGYPYTVKVIDADTFRILDNGSAVGFPDPGGLGGASTTYTGVGTATAGLSAASGQSLEDISSTLTGLASVAVTGGIALLNVTVATTIRTVDGTSGGSAPRVGGHGLILDDGVDSGTSPSFGSVAYQYSTNGTVWTDLRSDSVTRSGSVSLSIPIANADQLRLRVIADGEAGSGGSAHVSGTISAWTLDVPTVGVSSALTFVRAYRQYVASDFVSHSGHNWVALRDGVGGMTAPGSDATIWSLLPGSLTYEIPNSYAEADLFSIHYAQSGDVVTLTHQNYPPSELKRLGPALWKFTAINPGPLLSAPTQVTATASPGFLAQISSVTGTPSVFTTATNHTLAFGDGVYATNLVIGGVPTSDFYIVSDIPLDGSGNIIKNELKLMDYNGNAVTATLGSSPTFQYGGKIFDITNRYVVTAVSSDGINESKSSAEVSVLDNLNVTGSYNVIAWGAVASAARYNIYKKKNGLFGYIGQTTGLSFSDNNIAPDFSITPPTFDDVFVGEGNYPAAVSYFDQRRCFAGTANAPQDVWMTKTGTEADFSYSIPVKDTDRIYFRVASRESNTIQHIIPLTQLMLLTNSAELRVSPVNSDAITPSNISVRPQSYVGASSVEPSIVNNSLVYCAARGGHVREMGYSWTSNGFVTGDLSLRAAHLFDNLTIVDQAFAKCPRPIVWFVSSDGGLLGLTYIPEEQIGAWHHHATNGFFESIAAVSEGSEERLYAVIRRTINGQTVRYIERMASRIVNPDDLAHCFFVDAGSTYEGVPADTISGLTWLEGETVSILADGAVCPQQVVTGGSVTLPVEASVVQVGLPYNSDLDTLPLTLQIDGFGQGRSKNINKVWIRVWQSSGVFAGHDSNHLTEFKQRTNEAYGVAPSLMNNELAIVITPTWQQSGQISIRQSNPLPLSVVAVVMEVSVGG